MKIIKNADKPYQKNVTRYRLHKSIDSFCLLLDDGTESDIFYAPSEEDGIVFVDIIEPRKYGATALSKMKFYFPDGTIVVGRQFPSFFLELHMLGDCFDGRFNI